MDQRPSAARVNASTSSFFIFISAPTAGSVAGDAEHARVPEDGYVKVHRLFGLVVEPEEGRNCLNSRHGHVRASTG
jgi:hypothetical protein